MDLSVSTSLVDSENDDEEKMSAGLVAFISVRAALPQELSEAEAKEYPLSSAVSMAYAHAKSCFIDHHGIVADGGGGASFHFPPRDSLRLSFERSIVNLERGRTTETVRPCLPFIRASLLKVIKLYQ